MRGKFLGVIFLVLLISCSEETLPDGIYDYQVERLLSGESGVKTWTQIVNSNNCADSVLLTFELVANAADDSLDITMLSGCSPSNSTVLGRASASSPEGGILFTDSLIFASGEFWIIDQITSEQLFLRIDNEDFQYIED